MKTPGAWGFTPGERRALLLICAATLVGGGYRFISRGTIPPSVPLTAEDSLAIAAIAQAARPDKGLVSEPGDAGEDSLDWAAQEPPRLDQANLIDINYASREQLESLPGIGPVLADRLLAARQRRGGFTKAEDLLEIPGIGPRRLDQIRALICCETITKDRFDSLGHK